MNESLQRANKYTFIFSEYSVFTVVNCTATSDTVCSRCESDLIWSEDLARCVRCGTCCSNSTVDSACSGGPATGCIYDPGCTGIDEAAVTTLHGDQKF